MTSRRMSGRLFGTPQAERLGAVGGHDDLVALLLEGVAQQALDVGVVVDDEDLGGHRTSLAQPGRRTAPPDVTKNSGRESGSTPVRWYQRRIGACYASALLGRRSGGGDRHAEARRQRPDELGELGRDDVLGGWAPPIRLSASRYWRSIVFWSIADADS